MEKKTSLNKLVNAARQLLKLLENAKDRHIMIMANLAVSSTVDISLNLSDDMNEDEQKYRVSNLINDLLTLSEHIQNSDIEHKKIVALFLELTAFQLRTYA